MIRPTIKELVEQGEIDWDIYSNIPMNTDERQFLVPYLTDDALFQLINEAMKTLYQSGTSKRLRRRSFACLPT